MIRCVGSNHCHLSGRCLHCTCDRRDHRLCTSGKRRETNTAEQRNFSWKRAYPHLVGLVWWRDHWCLRRERQRKRSGQTHVRETGQREEREKKREREDFCVSLSLISLKFLLFFSFSPPAAPFYLIQAGQWVNGWFGDNTTFTQANGAVGKEREKERRRDSE